MARSDPGKPDRLAVVTGGASGIGAGIARRLLADGYRCAILDVKAPKRGGDEEPWPVEADVTAPDQVDSAFGGIEDHFGRSVDVLVCSAGIVGRTAPVEELPLETWERVLAVDLTGVFLSCRRVVPAMRKNRLGRIVNIASIAGKEGNPMMAPYAAAKAGVIGFTKALAKEVVGVGVTVNAIAPGLVRTELVESMAPDVRERLTSLIPMRRVAEVEEIAAAVSYLVNDATFSTGTVLDASGGRATY